jgi:hypothetical protein
VTEEGRSGLLSGGGGGGVSLGVGPGESSDIVDWTGNGGTKPIYVLADASPRTVPS